LTIKVKSKIFVLPKKDELTEDGTSGITTTANIAGAYNVIPMQQKKKDLEEHLDDSAGAIPYVGDDTMYDKSSSKLIPENLEDPGTSANQPHSTLMDIGSVEELAHHTNNTKSDILEAMAPYSNEAVNQQAYGILGGGPLNSSGINGLNASSMTVPELKDVIQRGKGPSQIDTPLAGNVIDTSALSDGSNADPDPAVTLDRIELIGEKLGYLDFDEFLDAENKSGIVNDIEVPYSNMLKTTDPQEYARREREYYDTVGMNQPNDYSINKKFMKEDFDKMDVKKIKDALTKLAEDIEELYDLLEDENLLDSDEDEGEDKLDLDGDEDDDITESLLKAKALKESQGRLPCEVGGFYSVMKNGKQVGFGIAGKNVNGKIKIGGVEFKSDDPDLMFVSQSIGQ